MNQFKIDYHNVSGLNKNTINKIKETMYNKAYWLQFQLIDEGNIDTTTPPICVDNAEDDEPTENESFQLFKIKRLGTCLTCASGSLVGFDL